MTYTISEIFFFDIIFTNPNPWDYPDEWVWKVRKLNEVITGCGGF